VSDRNYKKSGQEPKRPNFWSVPADQEKKLAFGELMKVMNGVAQTRSLDQNYGKR
jgi:hypothetical protein